jgi:Flp pilus assembly pilin Flp
LKHFATDDRGSTSIEYALVALILGVGIIAAVPLLGSQVQNTWSFVASQFTRA